MVLGKVTEYQVEFNGFDFVYGWLGWFLAAVQRWVIAIKKNSITKLFLN
jgi:hypothetical protein